MREEAAKLQKAAPKWLPVHALAPIPQTRMHAHGGGGVAVGPDGLPRVRDAMADRFATASAVTQ